MIEIQALKHEIQDLRHTLERCMKDKIERVVTPNVFTEKYGFTKLLTAADFESFDSRLKTEPEFHEDFVRFLYQEMVLLFILYGWEYRTRAI